MKRTVPGLLLALFWFVVLLKGSPLVFYFIMIGVAVIGGLEYYKMVFPEKGGIGSCVYLVLVLILPVLAAVPGIAEQQRNAVNFFAFFLTILFFITRYTHFDDSFNRLTRMIFGLVYVGGLMSFLLAIRYLPDGGRWLIVLTAITAGSDSGAYFVGSTIGKTKLCPGVSPKKTVEGALGGLAAGMLAACVFAGFLLADVSWWFLLPTTLVLTGVGMLGDLTESIVKRGTGVKDSGTLLSGHGGVLDRIDSLLLAAPVLYYLLALTENL